MRFFGGFIGLLFLFVLISPAWAGSGKKPSEMKVKLLYEESAGTVTSPSLSGEAPIPQAAEPESPAKSGIRKIHHPNFFLMILGIGFILLIAFAMKRSLSVKSDEDEW